MCFKLPEKTASRDGVSPSVCPSALPCVHISACFNSTAAEKDFHEVSCIRYASHIFSADFPSKKVEKCRFVARQWWMCVRAWGRVFQLFWTIWLASRKVARNLRTCRLHQRRSFLILISYTNMEPGRKCQATATIVPRTLRSWNHVWWQILGKKISA